MANPRSQRKAALDKQPKIVEWRGLELEFPPVLPATVFFDLNDAQEQDDALAYLRILRTLAGDEGYRQIRESLTAEDSFGAIVDELFDDVIPAAYGLDVGESSASSSSSTSGGRSSRPISNGNTR